MLATPTIRMYYDVINSFRLFALASLIISKEPRVSSVAAKAYPEERPEYAE